MEALVVALIAAAIIFGCIFIGRQWAAIREGDRMIADLYQLGGAYLAGRKSESAGADKKAPKCAESYYLGYEHGARDAVAAGALAALKKK